MSLSVEEQNRLLCSKLEQMRVDIAYLKTQNKMLKEENRLLNQRVEQLEQGYVTKMTFDKAIASIMNSIESLKSMHMSETSSEDDIDSSDLFLGDLFQQIADERESEVFENRHKQKPRKKSKTIDESTRDRRPKLTPNTIMIALNDQF